MCLPLKIKKYFGDKGGSIFSNPYSNVQLQLEFEVFFEKVNKYFTSAFEADNNRYLGY
jgi:hypothetical protein